MVTDPRTGQTKSGKLVTGLKPRMLLEKRRFNKSWTLKIIPVEVAKKPVK